jgi:hypothetical protein
MPQLKSKTYVDESLTLHATNNFNSNLGDGDGDVIEIRWPRRWNKNLYLTTEQLKDDLQNKERSYTSS